jgi:hypothetical protein
MESLWKTQRVINARDPSVTHAANYRGAAVMVSLTLRFESC